MKKFTNHVDHVARISRIENLDANAEELERLTEAKLVAFQRDDIGLAMRIDWRAGLEIIAPTEPPTEFNQMLHDWLNTRGEGVISVVFGVRDLERHKARLEALGTDVGPLMDDHPDSPWHSQLVLRERMAGTFMNSSIIFGDIDYADDLISFGDV